MKAVAQRVELAEWPHAALFVLLASTLSSTTKPISTPRSRDTQSGIIANRLPRARGSARRRSDIRPRDVVGLSAHGHEHSGLYGGETGPWQYTDQRERKGKPRVLLVDPGLQGLESPVVVLRELANFGSAVP